MNVLLQIMMARIKARLSNSKNFIVKYWNKSICINQFYKNPHKDKLNIANRRESMMLIWINSHLILIKIFVAWKLLLPQDKFPREVSRNCLWPLRFENSLSFNVNSSKQIQFLIYYTLNLICIFGILIPSGGIWPVVRNL